MTTGSGGFIGSGGTCGWLWRCWTRFATVFWNSVNILNCYCWFYSCTIIVSSVFFRLFSWAPWSYSLWETFLYCWSSSSESWSIRLVYICWNVGPLGSSKGLGTGFFWGLDIVKMPCSVFYVLYTRRFRLDTAFVCVIYVVRIVTALTCRTRKFCTVLTCVACWRRVDAVFICGVRRFSLVVSECARNVPKIWWSTDIEDFDVKKTYIQR